MDSNDHGTAAVHMYNPTTEVISHMRIPRYYCFAAVLPNNQLMVMGGWSDNDSVEVATVELQR